MRKTLWKCDMMNICTGQQQRLSSVAKRLVSCVQPSAQIMLGSVISWAPGNRDLTMGPLLMKRRGWQRMGWFEVSLIHWTCACVLNCKESDMSEVTVARQAALSTGFPRHEHWSGLSFPSPRDLPGSNLHFMSPALAGRFFTASTPWEAPNEYELSKFQEIRKDRGAWCAVVHGVAKSQTRFIDWTRRSTKPHTLEWNLC